MLRSRTFRSQSWQDAQKRQKQGPPIWRSGCTWTLPLTPNGWGWCAPFVTIEHRLGHLIHYHTIHLHDIVVLKTWHGLPAISLFWWRSHTSSTWLSKSVPPEPVMGWSARSQFFGITRLCPIFSRSASRLSYRVADPSPSNSISRVYRPARSRHSPGSLSAGLQRFFRGFNKPDLSHRNAEWSTRLCWGLFYQLIVRLLNTTGHDYTTAPAAWNCHRWRYNGALLEHGQRCCIAVRAYPQKFYDYVNRGSQILSWEF
jgi:hypothetical protein